MENPVRRQLHTRDEATSEAELLQLFREDPGALLHTFGDTDYRWPEPGPTPASPPNMLFSRGRFVFGHVERMHWLTGYALRIEHFAIGRDMMARTGLGTCLALWLRAELKRRYPLSAIHFREYQFRPQDHAFFNSLGASFLRTVDYCDEYRWEA